MESPVLTGRQLQTQQNARGESERRMVCAGCNEGRSSTVALHSFDDVLKIVSFDDKNKFLYHFDAPAVITGCFRAPDMADTKQKIFNQFAEIVCPVEQHGVRIDEALRDVLCHAASEKL
jgi:hypothetical protein